jgi:putative oxidoreductase
MKEKFRLTSLLFGQIEIDNKLANAALLLLRLYAGYTIMTAGLDKLPLTDWMIDQVTEMGFPFPVFFAWLASFSEFAFGLLLGIGLMTRFSGIMLAITMGVASFGFQKAIPLIDMHIAQHFFWIFILFTVVGAGKFSIDTLLYDSAMNRPSKLSYLSIPVFLLLLAFGLYREFLMPIPESESGDQAGLTSVNVAGSFNDWDPSQIEMSSADNKTYFTNVEFENQGLVEFKFTANKSWDVSWGETDQSAVGFPVQGIGELDQGSSTSNIRVYIPNPGRYRFTFDIEDFAYSIDSLKSE